MTSNRATRLHVLLARARRAGVIFRRGPSRQVQLIKWNLQDDTFEPGQWFKGRIYERRCDLSPSGDFLIYFAAKYRGPAYSWTAISKPPYLTAIALWPKGDCWNGGGMFIDEHTIHLDHPREQAAPHADFASAARKVRIASYAQWRGEDAPVWNAVRGRDGWVQRDTAANAEEVWQKAHPRRRGTVLVMTVAYDGRKNRSWYMLGYRVIRADGTNVLMPGACDWADWDRNGDLLFARDGSLYRQPIGSAVGEPRPLADFTTNQVTAIEAPSWARSF